MKKVLSLFYIFLIIISGSMLASCTRDPYAKVRMQFIINEVAVDDSNVHDFVLDSKADNVFDVSVQVSGAPSNIGALSFSTKNSTTSFTLINNPKRVGNLTTVKLQANSAGEGVLYARLLETNKEISIPIKMVRQVNGVSGKQYNLGVQVGQTVKLVGSNLLNFTPYGTNQLDVTYRLDKSSLANVTLTEDMLSIGKDYILTDATKKISIVASSTALTADSTEEDKKRLTAKFDVFVVDSSSLEVQYYNNAAHTPIDESEEIMMAKGKENAKYNTITVDVDTTGYYKVGSSGVSIRAYSESSQVVVAESKGIVDGKARFLLYTNADAGVAKVTFEAEYIGISEVKSVKRTINVRVVDLPTAILVNNSSSVHDYDIFTHYNNSSSGGSNGQKLSVSLLPYNLLPEYRKVFLLLDVEETIRINNNAVGIDAIALSNLLKLVTVNNIEVKSVSSIYEINHGVEYYLSINESSEEYGALLPLLSNGVVLQASANKVLESFGGNKDTVVDLIKMRLTFKIRQGTTGINAYDRESSLPQYDVSTTEGQINLVSTEILSVTPDVNVAPRTVYARFAPIGLADVQNTSININSSNSDVVKFYHDAQMLDKLSGNMLTKTASNYYTFALAGMKVGTSTITIRSGNGTSMSFVVSVKIPTNYIDATLGSDTNSDNIGYQNKVLNNTPTLTYNYFSDIAIKLGKHVPINFGGNYSGSSINVVSMEVEDPSQNVIAVSNSGKSIAISAIGVGSTIIKYRLEYYDISGNKHVTDEISSKIHVYIPVQNMELSTYFESLYYNVGEYYLESTGFDYSVIFNNLNATKNINLSSGTDVSAYYFEMELGDKNFFDFTKSQGIDFSDAFTNKLVITDYNMKLYLQNEMLINLKSTEILITLYQFGAPVKVLRTELYIQRAEKVETVSVTNVGQREDRTLYLNLDLRNGHINNGNIDISSPESYVKHINVDISNPITATFPDIAMSVTKGDPTLVKMAKNANTFFLAPNSNLGGVVTVRIYALDSVSKGMPYGENGVDITVEISDGINTPFYIKNAGQLLAIGKDSETMAYRYALMNDIDMSLVSETSLPIGGTKPFTGELTGAYIKGDIVITRYTIRGVKLTQSATESIVGEKSNVYSGLFANNQGKLSHMTLDDVTISLAHDITGQTNVYIGSLAAKNSGEIIESMTTIKSEIGQSVIYDSRSTNAMYLGGLVGMNAGSIINDNDGMASGQISVTNKSMDSHVSIGGVVGYNIGLLRGNYISKYMSGDVNFGNNNSFMSNISANIDVTLVDSTENQNVSLGGVVGWTLAGINNLSYNGSIVGKYNVGGIIGKASITDTYNGVTTDNVVHKYLNTYASSIVGRENVGGLVGRSMGAAYHTVGVEFLSIEGQTFDSRVVGQKNVGGLVGYDQSSNYTYAYTESFVGGGAADITLTADAQDGVMTGYAGGLIGAGTNSAILQSYSKVNIANANASGKVSGLIGSADTVMIRDSFFRGTLMLGEMAMDSSGYEELYSIVGEGMADIDSTYVQASVQYNGGVAVFESTILDGSYGTLSGKAWIISMLLYEGSSWKVAAGYNGAWPIQSYEDKYFGTQVPNSILANIVHMDNILHNDNDEKLGYNVSNIATSARAIMLFRHNNGEYNDVRNQIKLKDILNVVVKSEDGQTIYNSHIISIIQGKGTVISLKGNSDIIELSGNGKARLKIYSPYNSSLVVLIDIYVTHGVSQYDIYNTANLTNENKLNNRELILKAESKTTFTSRLYNGGYDVNAFVNIGIKSDNVASKILVEGSQIGADYSWYNANDTLNVETIKLDNDTNSVTNKYTLLPAINVSVVFGSGQFNTAMFLMEDLMIRFDIKVSNTASKLTLSAMADDIESGEMARIDAQLHTNYMSSSIESWDYKTKIFDPTSLCANSDELKAVVSIAGNAEYYAERFGNIAPSELFDVYAEVSLQQGYIVYKNLSLSLKEEYQYIEQMISFDIMYYATSDRDVYKTYTLNIYPQTIRKITANHYANGEVYVDESGSTVLQVEESSSGFIEPGRSGLLKIITEPKSAYVDYYDITSSVVNITTNGVSKTEYIQFEQMVYSQTLNNYISLYHRPTNIPFGIQLRKITTLKSDGSYEYDGTIYVRTVLNSILAKELLFDLTINAYLDGQTSPIKTEKKSLLTSYIPHIELKVASQYDIKVTDNAGYQHNVVERGSSNLLVYIDVIGYEVGNFSCNSSIAVITKSGDSIITDTGSLRQYYIVKVTNGVAVGTVFDVSASIVVAMNGILNTANKNLSFVVVDTMLTGKSATLKDLNEDDELAFALGTSKVLDIIWTTAGGKTNIDLTNKMFADLGGINGGVPSEEALNNYLRSFYFVQNTITGPQQVPLNTVNKNWPFIVQEYILTNESDNVLKYNYALIAQSPTAGDKLGFKGIYIKYVWNNGQPEYVFTNNAQNGSIEISFNFDINIYYQIDEKLPIAIYSADKFADYLVNQPNENYILMNDIILENWTPINANFLSLDGNNKKIIIKSFAVDKPSASTTIVGLFKEVSGSTLLKNLTVDISQMNNELDMSEHVSYIYGTIAGINRGIITNCEVVSLSAARTSTDAIAQTKSLTITGSGKVGLFVGENSGNISNSRVGTPYFNTITGTATKPIVMTKYSTKIVVNAGGVLAGFVSSNAGNISSSFVRNASVINTSTVLSQSHTAGFVNNNSGNIFYCYVKSAGEMTNAKPRLEINLVQSKGNVAGFVSENSGLVADSYANIKVKSINMHTAGFVSKNTESGKIQRSYSASKIESYDLKYMPFVASDELTEHVEDYSNGGVEDCYFLILPNEYYYTLTLGEPAQEMSLSSMKLASQLNNFTFIESSSNAEASLAIWSYRVIDDEAPSETVGVLPDLTSANIISSSVRLPASSGNITSYVYVTGYDPGSKKNPYIIRHASEYNSLFGNIINDGKTKKVNKYIRQVADIDFADTGYEIATRENVIFSGHYDGNGMTISNISISAEIKGADTSIGLFSRIEKDNTPDAITPVFKNTNLGFNSVSATAVTYVGGLAGVIDSAFIMNLNLNGDNAYIRGHNIVGGLAGIIKGNSKILNIGTNLSISVGWHSNATVTGSKVTASGEVINTIYPIVNEYYSKDNFDKLKSLGKIPNIDSYVDYMSTLSYGGGLAGIIDIDNGKSSVSSTNNEDINVKLITINTGKTGDNTNKQVKVSADNTGGLTGYAGVKTYISRIKYVINNNSNAVNNLQYLDGYYSVGGLIAVHYGVLTLSEVADNLTQQLALDKRLALNMLGIESTIDRGNIDLIRGSYFAGGLIGMNYGGRVEHSYTKGSLSGANARYLGGIAGMNVSGGYNTVYTTSTLPLNNSNTTAIGGLFGLVLNNYNPSLAYTDYNYTVNAFTALYGKADKFKTTLNKINALNNYYYDDVIAYVASDYKASLGTMIGHSFVAKEQFLGSGLNSTEGNIGAPTDTNAILNIRAGDTIIADVNQVGGSGVNIVEKHVNLYNLINIFSTDSNSMTDQLNAYEQLFTTWPVVYWAKDTTKMYPLLERQGYGNVIEITNEEDFGMINQNPSATFLIKNDITMVSNYLNCIISANFTGQLLGDKGQGLAPKITIKNLSAVDNAQQCLAFFHSAEGARFENIIFSYEIFNYGNKSGTIGGLIATDVGSSISQIVMSGNIGGEGVGASVGGLIGSADSSSINSCTSAININVTNALNVGGLVGQMTSSAESTIATKEEDSSGTQRFGSVGASAYTGKIKAINTMPKSDKDNHAVKIGGLIGNSSRNTINSNMTPSAVMIDYKSSELNSYVGGLIGYSDNDKIIGCTEVKVKIRTGGHSLTNNTAIEYIGGLVGIMVGGDISNCSVSGTGDDGYIIAYDSSIDGSSVTRSNIVAMGGVMGGVSGGCQISNVHSFGGTRLTNKNINKTSTQHSSITTLIAGGIVGLAEGRYDISSGYANTVIEIDNPNNTVNAGGLVGQSRQDSDAVAKIDSSASYGTLSVKSAGKVNIGGILGRLESKGLTINSCQTAGNIITGSYSSASIGGIVGGGTANTFAADYNMVLTAFDMTALRCADQSKIQPFIGDHTIIKIAKTGSTTTNIYSSDYTMLIDTSVEKNGVNLVASDLLRAGTTEENINDKAIAVKMAFNKISSSDKNYVFYAYLSPIATPNEAVWIMGYGSNAGAKQTLPYLAVLEYALERDGVLTGANGTLLVPNQLSNNVKSLMNGVGSYNVLMTDITIDQPLITGEFNGKLIGAGNKIMYKNNNAPLIGKIATNGAVSNVQLVFGGSAVTTVGNYGFFTAENSGTIFACGVSSTLEVSITSNGAYNFGGIAANNSGYIMYSFNMARVKNIGFAKSGGLVAHNTKVISKSYFTGSLSGGAGLVNANMGTISDSYTAGTITSGSVLVGEGSTGTMSNVYVDFYGTCTGSGSNATTTNTISLFKNEKSDTVSLLGSGWKSIRYTNDSIVKTVYNYGYPIVDVGLKKYVGGLNNGLQDLVMGIGTGNGTAASPLLVPNLGALDYARSLFGKTFITNYELVNDITVRNSYSGTGIEQKDLCKNWDSSMFINGKLELKTTFSGGGKTITGIKGQSLFSSSSGKIRSMNVQGFSNASVVKVNMGEINGVNIIGEMTSNGAIAQEMTGGYIINSKTTSKITGTAGVVGVLSGGTIESSNSFEHSMTVTNGGGGIVGEMTSGAVNNPTIDITVSGTSGSIGGIIGRLSLSGHVSLSTRAKIKFVMTGNKMSAVGGLAHTMSGGTVQDGAINLIMGGSATGAVSINADTFGGAVAIMTGGQLNVSVSGNVTVAATVGGVVGRLSGGEIELARLSGLTIKNNGNITGGFVGDMSSGELKTISSDAASVIESTNAGADAYAGGMIGNYAGGSIPSESRALTIKGVNNVGGIFGKLSTTCTLTLINNAKVSATGTNAGGIIGNYVGGLVLDGLGGSLTNKGLIIGRENVGGLFGTTSIDVDPSKIVDAVNKAVTYTNAAAVSGTVSVGGIVGDTKKAIISNANANDVSAIPKENPDNVKVPNIVQIGRVSGIEHFATSGAKTYASKIGGIVGTTSGMVTNVKNFGEVSAVALSANVGGVIGYNTGKHVGTLTMYNAGAVSGDTNVGGLMGVDTGRGTYVLANVVYQSGNVTGQKMVGGLFGKTTAPTLTQTLNESSVDADTNIIIANGTIIKGAFSVGGLIGEVSELTTPKKIIIIAKDIHIIGQGNTHNTSGTTSFNVSGQIGGVIGRALSCSDVKVEARYHSSDITGQTDVGGIVGKTSGGSMSSGTGLHGSVTITANAVGEIYSENNANTIDSAPATAGGIIGSNNSGSVSGVTLGSEIRVVARNAGGIVGMQYMYNAATVSGNHRQDYTIGTVRSGRYTVDTKSGWMLGNWNGSANVTVHETKYNASYQLEVSATSKHTSSAAQDYSRFARYEMLSNGEYVLSYNSAFPGYDASSGTVSSAQETMFKARNFGGYGQVNTPTTRSKVFDGLFSEGIVGDNNGSSSYTSNFTASYVHNVATVYYKDGVDKEGKPIIKSTKLGTNIVFSDQINGGHIVTYGDGSTEYRSRRAYSSPASYNPLINNRVGHIGNTKETAYESLENAKGGYLEKLLKIQGPFPRVYSLYDYGDQYNYLRYRNAITGLYDNMAIGNYQQGLDGTLGSLRIREYRYADLNVRLI